MKVNECPICRNVLGGSIGNFETDDDNSVGFQCSICGKYEIIYKALEGDLNPDGEFLSNDERALLSHRLRVEFDQGRITKLDTYWWENCRIGEGFPDIGTQQRNLINFIGNQEKTTGQRIPSLPHDISTIVGTEDKKTAIQIAIELLEDDFIKGRRASNDPNHLVSIGLSDKALVTFNVFGGEYSPGYTNSSNQSDEGAEGTGNEWESIAVENYDEVAGEMTELAQTLDQSNEYRDEHSEEEVEYTVQSLMFSAENIRESKGKTVKKNFIFIGSLLAKLSSFFGSDSPIGKRVEKVRGFIQNHMT